MYVNDIGSTSDVILGYNSTSKQIKNMIDVVANSFLYKAEKKKFIP